MGQLSIENVVSSSAGENSLYASRLRSMGQGAYEALDGTGSI